MQRIPIRVTAARFGAAVKIFATSNVGWKAKLLFAMLVVLLLGVNALNVGNSYVGRNFMSAIQERNRPEFTVKPSSMLESSRVRLSSQLPPGLQKSASAYSGATS